MVMQIKLVVVAVVEFVPVSLTGLLTCCLLACSSLEDLSTGKPKFRLAFLNKHIILYY